MVSPFQEKLKLTYKIFPTWEICFGEKLKDGLSVLHDSHETNSSMKHISIKCICFVLLSLLSFVCLFCSVCFGCKVTKGFSWLVHASNTFCSHIDKKGVFKLGNTGMCNDRQFLVPCIDVSYHSFASSSLLWTFASWQFSGKLQDPSSQMLSK